MKRIFTAVILLFALSTAVRAQFLHPVKWKFNAEPAKQETVLKFSADIEEGWHIYSQYTDDGGPLPMVFTYDSAVCYKLIGKVTEPKQIEEFDSLFLVNVKYLEGKPLLSQKVEILKTPCKISGKIEYQACKDACIPLDTTFSITVK